MKLNDLSGLKDLAKKMKKEEKPAPAAKPAAPAAAAPKAEAPKAEAPATTETTKKEE